MCIRSRLGCRRQRLENGSNQGDFQMGSGDRTTYCDTLIWAQHFLFFLAGSQASPGLGTGVLLPSWGHLCFWALPICYLVSLLSAKQLLRPLLSGGAIASLVLALAPSKATLAPSLTCDHAVVPFQMQALLSFLSPGVTGQQVRFPGRRALELTFHGALSGRMYHERTVG